MHPNQLLISGNIFQFHEQHRKRCTNNETLNHHKRRVKSHCREPGNRQPANKKCLSKTAKDKH